jgi:hypothetical protein
MEDFVGGLYFFASLIVPFVVGWWVIYSAVLAALRRHDRDQAAL